MSKGSARRPGDIKPGAWEAIFAPAPVGCRKCPRDPSNVCDYCGCDLSIPAPKIDTSGEPVDSVNVTDWSQA